MDLLAVHEGGYVDHPDDPGGRTNKGVTQEVYDAYRSSRGLEPAHVRDITRDEVEEIYRSEYWDAIRADELPAGVAYAVFDAAVNSGPARAARWLQKAVGAKVDGVVGRKTLAKTRAARPEAVIDSVCEKRLRFMRRLKHYDTFGVGWERRVSEVQQQALRWAKEARVHGEDGVTERAKGERPAAGNRAEPAASPRTWTGVLADVLEAIREALQ
jgi:lysozyme family protein